MTTEFPTLHVAANGNSGISIRAKLTKKYNCVEFTLRDDVPQDVFISPWMQFEPIEMEEERLKLAYEIARRATMHDALVKEIAHLQAQLKQARDINRAQQKTQDTTNEMWKADRKKASLPEDFSDIKVWPPEMMSGYRGEEH